MAKSKFKRAHTAKVAVRHLAPIVYLHYGDESHRPMQTIRFTGSRSQFMSAIREAKSNGCPLSVAAVLDDGVPVTVPLKSYKTFASRYLPARAPRK